MSQMDDYDVETVEFKEFEEHDGEGAVPNPEEVNLEDRKSVV